MRLKIFCVTCLIHLKTREFALSQLAHIQQLREKEKEKEEGREGENTPKIE